MNVLNLFYLQVVLRHNLETTFLISLVNILKADIYNVTPILICKVGTFISQGLV